MGEMIKMVVVLTILSLVSGGGLSFLEQKLKPLQEKQIMEVVKGPAVRDLFENAKNDPVADRFKIQHGKNEETVFVGVTDNNDKVLVLESQANGYGGPVGLIVGINADKNEVAGVRVTTHAETAGLGSRAKDDPSFVAQFANKPIDTPFAFVPNGGDINALGGATITSQAVVKAANQAVDKYKDLKPQLLEKAQSIN